MVTSTSLRVLAVPIADVTTASSRLRLHALLQAAGARVEADVVDASLLADVDVTQVDVVYVQKVASPLVVAACRRAVDAGIPVVYDIEDDFGCWPGMDELAMCHLATTVTVDCRGRAEAVRPLTRRPVVVLPCMIDAAHVERSGPRPRHGAVATVASFGNAGSVVHAVPYLTALPPGIATYLVGPPRVDAPFGGHRLVPFDLDGFVEQLLPADAFVLAHGPVEAPRKDANRLVMAMSLGIPSLVTPTPAHVDLLDALELGDLVCPEPADVPERLAPLHNPAHRTRIAVVAHDYVWDTYSPARCADAFLQVLGSAAAA